VVLPSDVQMMYTKLKQQFTLQHRDAWSGLVAPAIVHELAAASSEGVRDFFRVCKEVFTQGTWGGSIGGQAWAQIAAVGEQYWNGDITTTVFVDRVFDLRHNTGTVLNKHEMVNNHPMMRSPLSAQLDMKRQDLQTKQKWEAMLALHNDVNQELTNLYAEGQQKGIWT